jgi:hypothetical protein
VRTGEGDGQILPPRQVRIVELLIGAIKGHDFEDIALRFGESNFGGENARVALIRTAQPARDVIFAPL